MLAIRLECADICMCVHTVGAQPFVMQILLCAFFYATHDVQMEEKLAVTNIILFEGSTDCSNSLTFLFTWNFHISSRGYGELLLAGISKVSV